MIVTELVQLLLPFGEGESGPKGGSKAPCRSFRYFSCLCCKRGHRLQEVTLEEVKECHDYVYSHFRGGP